MLIIVPYPHCEFPDSGTFWDASKLAGERVERLAVRQRAVEDSPIIAGQDGFRGSMAVYGLMADPSGNVSVRNVRGANADVVRSL